MIPYFSIIVGVFLFDLLTKYLVRSFVPFGSGIPLLPFFSLVHVENTGVAFGFFQGKNTLLLILGLLVLSGLLVWGSNRKTPTIIEK